MTFKNIADLNREERYGKLCVLSQLRGIVGAAYTQPHILVKERSLLIYGQSQNPKA